MRLFIACALVLATIAVVQSNPISSQLGNLADVHNAFPQHSELINQLISVAGQIEKYVSNEKLQSLTQRAFQLAHDVSEGRVGISAAITELLQQVKAALGPNSPIPLGHLDALARKVEGAILEIFSQMTSNSGKRSAAVARNGLSALINQAQLNDLIAAFPQFSELINQLISVAGQIEKYVSNEKLQLLTQRAFQLAHDVSEGRVDISAAITELLQQVKGALGPNSPIPLGHLDALAQKVEGAILGIFSQMTSNSGKRSAAVARNGLSALINQAQLNDLIAAYPQFSNLVNKLMSIAAQVDYALSQTQSDALKEEAIQIAQNVLNGQIDINMAIQQLFQKVDQALGPNSSILSNAKDLIQELQNAIAYVLSNLPSN